MASRRWESTGREPPSPAKAIEMKIFRQQDPGENRADNIDHEVRCAQRKLAPVQRRTQRLLGGQRHGNPSQIGRQNAITKLL